MEINKIEIEKRIEKTKKPKQFNNTDKPLDKVIRKKKLRKSNQKVRHVLSKILKLVKKLETNWS